MKKWKLLVLVNLMSVTVYGHGFVLPDTSSVADSVKNTCVIDFEKGLDEVLLGKTKLKTVKKKYGKIEAKKDKTFFDLALGLYNVTVVLSYPNVGLEFIYDSTLDRLTRIFRPKKVNVIHVLKNCPCKTKEGIGIGSTYNDIQSAFNTKLTFLGVNSDSLYSQVYTDIELPSGKSVSIEFIGDHVKDKSEFIVKRIDYFIRR